MEGENGRVHRRTWRALPLALLLGATAFLFTGCYYDDPYYGRGYTTVSATYGSPGYYHGGYGYPYGYDPYYYGYRRGYARPYGTRVVAVGTTRPRGYYRHRPRHWNRGYTRSREYRRGSGEVRRREFRRGERRTRSSDESVEVEGRIQTDVER